MLLSSIFGQQLAYAFTAGLVAAINPCGFALLPAYLSYFLGLDQTNSGTGNGTDGDETASTDSVATATTTSNRDATTSRVRTNPIVRALIVSLAVTAGFVLVFAIMGFAWSSISGLIGRRLPYFTLIVGVFLAILGVAMLRGFEPLISLPQFTRKRQDRELGSMFIYGVSYAVASLSCTIPIFMAVVITTLERDSFATGIAVFITYALGMGTTLAVLTVSVALAREGLVQRFRRILPYMNTISGVLLIIAAAFVTYYAWVEIQELNTQQSSSLVKWSRSVQASLQRWVETVGPLKLGLGALVVIVTAFIITALLRSTSRSNPS